jgi:DNA-binding MarR family transcriptional regulator
MQVKSSLLGSLDLCGTGSCAAFNFRRTARAVTRLFDLALEPSRIRSTQFAILTAVAKFQPVSISRIGDILVLDPTTLTRSLRLLEKQGLLEISPRSTRRHRFISLTDEGAKSLALAIPLWRKVQAEFLGLLESWESLRDELERLSKLAVDLESAALNSKSTTTKGQAEPGTI